MRKHTVKSLINSFLFVDLCAVATIGVMLGFIIPKGRVRGVSHAFLGLTRHQWGDLHFFLAGVFLCLLIGHIWMNRSGVMNAVERYFGGDLKRALQVLASAWLMLLMIGWLFAMLN